jgi:hypothetical protein
MSQKDNQPLPQNQQNNIIYSLTSSSKQLPSKVQMVVEMTTLFVVTVHYFTFLYVFTRVIIKYLQAYGMPWRATVYSVS